MKHRGLTISLRPSEQYEHTVETERGRQQSVNLNRNVTARYVEQKARLVSLVLISHDRIQNPLAGIPRHTLLSNVEQFANDAGMTEHIPLLKKGALVAQDPPAFEQITELDDFERDALRNEVLHKWRQPIALYFTVILCSVGAAVQGWDQTGSNGANLSWPVAFGVPDSPVVKNQPVPGVDYSKNSWIVGVVNAGPYLGSAFMLVYLVSPNTVHS